MVLIREVKVLNWGDFYFRFELVYSQKVEHIVIISSPSLKNSYIVGTMLGTIHDLVKCSCR